MDFEALIKEEIVPYDAEKYNFQAIIAKILKCEDRDMTLLHTTVPGSENSPVLTFAADQCLVFHRMYYDSPLLQEMLDLFHKFVREVVAPSIKDDVIVYQKKPTFRVHLPNNTAVPSDTGGDPERPGLHCDSQYNHPPGEINFWVPVCQTTEMSTMWLESERGKKDFHPAILGNGHFLRFWGNQVFHYNKINRGGLTRVSFDFRVIPLSQYRTDIEVKNSVQSARKFTVGDGDMDYYTTYDKRTGGKYVFPPAAVPAAVTKASEAAAEHGTVVNAEPVNA